MAFQGMTIRSRLYFGFGAVVALTLALAAFSAWQSLGFRAEIATMANVSDAALGAREVAEQLQAIRRATLKYAVDGEERSFKEAEERETGILEVLKRAKDLASSEERRAIYQGLEASVMDLRASRISLGEIVARKISGRAALFTGGDEFAAATQKLVQAAHDEGDPALIESAAKLETDVLLTGIANWRFLATLDPSGALNFHVIAAKTARQIAAMRKPDLPAAIADQIAAVSASLKAYNAAFELASTNMIDANDLYAKKIRAPAIASSEIIDRLNLAYQQDLQAERARSDTAIATTLDVQKLAASLIVLLSAAVAFFVARGISGPLGLLNLAMQKLASGDHDVAIPAKDGNDEVGKMTKAVRVFKDAAIEKARLEAEAADQRQRAEGERARNADAQRDAIEQERRIVTQSIGAALAKLAAKDLTYRMPSEIPEAYRMLQADFNAAIGQLDAAIRSVTASTSAIDGGARDISAASADLSNRTERQAASLEETATALDEITATVKKSAENANHARQVVSVADADAKQSASVVGQAVAAMEGIAKSAQQIGQIIGVMDEIAFQTNLLALNAGVEAARAGEAGKGFAVVASEVRALAQRSAEAAKEIKGLISASSAQVENGVKLVAATGTSLKRIMDQVAEINSIVADIAAGAQEQSTGLQQVNGALDQMDQVTQQNSTMVEQSTAASRSLSREATQLSELVGQFKVAGPSRDDGLRDQLKKAAPHVFRPPPKAPAGARKAEPRAVAPAPVKAVAKSGGADWDEF